MESRALKLYDRRASLSYLTGVGSSFYIERKNSLCSKQMMMPETRWIVGAVGIPHL